LNVAAETIKEVDQLGFPDDADTDSPAAGSSRSATSPATAAAAAAGGEENSPARKRRGLFASYDKHLQPDGITVSPSAAAVVTLYCDNLPTLNAKARQSGNYWEEFKHDERFKKLHKVIEKFLCVPASSAPVERIFSHGGLFMKPHRARLGPSVLSNLVFSKCNMHLQNLKC
jgi:hypothetical protein